MMNWYEWFQKSLQDGDIPSSSRWLTALATLLSCGWITYYLVRFGHFPDATTLAGLASFNTAPYLVNRATCAYEKKNNP